MKRKRNKNPRPQFEIEVLTIEKLREVHAMLNWTDEMWRITRPKESDHDIHYRIHQEGIVGLERDKLKQP